MHHLVHVQAAHLTAPSKGLPVYHSRYSSAGCAPSGAPSGWMMLSSSLAGLFTLVEPGTASSHSAPGTASPATRLNGTPRKRTLSAAEVADDDRDDGRGRSRPGAWARWADVT